MNIMEHAKSTVGMPIPSRINSVGGQLAQSFRSLLDGLPGSPPAARQMAEVLNVDKNLIHKLLRALRSKDPLATAHSIPGPEPLMRVVEAAKAKGASIEVVRAAESAVAAFKHLIHHEIGDRSGLDAIISAMLPDARERIESLAKQSVYRGMRQLKGLSADVTFRAVVLSPSAKGKRCDTVLLQGYLGLRCVRPGAAMKIALSTRVSGVENANGVMLTLDGTPVTDPRQTMLKDFCVMTPVEFQICEKKETTILTVGWGTSIGPGSACDFVTAERRYNVMRRWRTPNDSADKSGIHDGISVPTPLYIYDLLLHEDVYPDWEPRVRIYEMGERGLASVSDESREADLLDLDVHVKSMGRGIDHFRAKEIPDYVGMLTHVCDKIGVSPRRLRGYRTRIDYPVFGTQLQYAFDVPVIDSAPASDPNASAGESA